jgi:UDP-N-acetyl-2-amino-2-deoxyglucuronate dehydrogenase
MFQWIFGKVTTNIVHIKTHDRVAGLLEFEKARVRYFMSINSDTLPPEIRGTGQRIYRAITVDGNTFDFTDALQIYIQSPIKKFSRVKDLELMMHVLP